MPPFIPLFKPYTPPAASAALEPVLASGHLAVGPQTAAFEHQLADWLGVPHCIALSDVSGAILLALYLAGVRPGDEVIASPLACAASLMPIANLFARPVWCDINPATGMPTASHIARCIGPKTRAVLLYHWSGNVADVAPIATLCKEHHIPLIQDANEAFGAEFRGQRLGTETDFTLYSFYATRHIHCIEGAALLATDPAMLDTALRLRRFGLDTAKLRLPSGDLNPDVDIPLAGFNLQMNEISATLGLKALPQADDILTRRRTNAAYYDAVLAGQPDLTLIPQQADTASAYWTYALRAKCRDKLITKLTAHGIGAQRLHVRNDRYTCFGGRQHDLPGVATFDAENLSIPCGEWVREEERQHIATCIQSGW